MTTGQHEITVLNEWGDPDRDEVTLTINCPMSGCVHGQVRGRPASVMRQIVEFIKEAHQREHGADVSEESS